jgi:hypothetical protein
MDRASMRRRFCVKTKLRQPNDLRLPQWLIVLQREGCVTFYCRGCDSALTSVFTDVLRVLFFPLVELAFTLPLAFVEPALPETLASAF